MTLEISKLSNGLTVVTDPMPSLESAALGVWVNTGSRNEKPAEMGVSHMLEHMAFKGTKRRSARQIAEEIEQVGGDINAATSSETTAYTASKHALLGVARCMAWELASRNIRVNVLNPGWVDTDMARDSLQRMADAGGKTLAQTTQEALSVLPIRRMAKPSEVAGYVKFLVTHPAADGITGQGIDLSCGSVMVFGSATRKCVSKSHTFVASGRRPVSSDEREGERGDRTEQQGGVHVGGFG